MTTVPYPDFVLQYAMAMEKLKQMKQSYDAQTQGIRDEMDQLRPRVNEWLQARPKGRCTFELLTDQQKEYLGNPMSLELRKTNPAKPLTRKQLDVNNHAFFQGALRARLECMIPQELCEQVDFVALAQLCTDYQWRNRVHREREELVRTFHQPRRKRRRVVFPLDEDGDPERDDEKIPSVVAE